MHRHIWRSSYRNCRIRAWALLSISSESTEIVMESFIFHTSKPAFEEDDEGFIPSLLPSDFGLLDGLELLWLLGVESSPRHHFRNSSKVIALGSFGRIRAIPGRQIAKEAIE